MRIQAHTISQGCNRRVSPLHRHGPRFLTSARLPCPVRVCHSSRSILLAKFPLSYISVPVTNVHGPSTMVKTLAPLAFIDLRSRDNDIRNTWTTTRKELAFDSKGPRGPTETSVSPFHLGTPFFHVREAARIVCRPDTQAFPDCLLGAADDLKTWAPHEPGTIDTGLSALKKCGSGCRMIDGLGVGPKYDVLFTQMR